jgi:hypothetical protein
MKFSATHLINVHSVHVQWGIALQSSNRKVCMVSGGIAGSSPTIASSHAAHSHPRRLPCTIVEKRQRHLNNASAIISHNLRKAGTDRAERRLKCRMEDAREMEV